MLTTRRPLAAGFSRGGGGMGLVVALLLAGCATERETTLSRAARQREVGALRAERQRLDQERGVLARLLAEQQVAIATAKTGVVDTAAEQRATHTALAYDLARLQQAERDLAEARARAQQIERELAPLRALEATLRDQERLRAELAAKLPALQAEVATLQAQVAAQEADLRPKLDGLGKKLDVLKQLGVTVAAAEAAILQAAATLAPPPPPKESAPAKK